MNKLLGLLLLFLTMPVAAQVTSAKPATPSLDTGETHFPDHLWLMNEGSTSTLEDDGDGGDLDMTCSGTSGGGPDWGTDGTHGDKLTFVAANEDLCVNNSVSGLSGTQVYCVIAQFSAGTGVRHFGSMTDPSQNDRKARFYYAGDEDIEAAAQWDNTETTNTSTQDGTGGWDLVCMRFSDSVIDWSLNGANWDTAAPTNTGLVAGITAIALGADYDSSPGGFFDGGMIAAFLFNSDKDNTAIAAIYNSGNPWPIIGVDSGSAATFTDGPTPGVATTTTLPFTFTSDSTGTVYGVACPDGQAAPSVAQVFAGDCTGDVTAESAFSEAVTATVSDGETFTGLTAATTYDTHFAIDAAFDSAAVSSVPDQDTAAVGSPTFSVAPSCSATTDGVSCTYTASATSTAYGVGVNPGDGTPSCTQIKAGQNDAGSAAIATGTDANTGTADTIAVTGSNAPPRLDYHFCLNNGSGDSSVDSSRVNEDRSPRSGFALQALSSIESTSPFDLDAYFDPDVATGDVVEYEDDTNENADCNVSIETDGDVVLTPVVAGDCDGKQTFNISYQDISSATTGLFTAPAAGNFTTDDLICVNNSAPEAEDPFETPILWVEDEAITALDLTAYFNDADGDTLTFTLTTGTWPTGVSQSGTGNKDVTGTPTTENEAGVTLVVTATDECGDSDTFSFYDGVDVYVVNTWAVPDLTALSPTEAEDAIENAAPWRVNDIGLTIGGYSCGSGQPFLTVAEHDPAEGEEAEPFEDISATIVGALIPDLVGLTQAEAIAAIEAICP